MRHALAAAFVAAAMSISAAETDTSTEPVDAFLMGDALREEVAQKCGAGCVTFNRTEAVSLERAIAALMSQAFALGQQEGSSRCRI